MDRQKEGRRDVSKFPPVSYRTSALWGRCPKSRLGGLERTMARARMRARMRAKAKCESLLKKGQLPRVKSILKRKASTLNR